MASRPTLHSQLSSIMETMANSVLNQVYKLVDEDSIEIRSDLSRLLAANSNLSEKVKSLENELTAVRSEPPKRSMSNRSVGVQTVCYKDDACVSGSPTIAGIFGKDWCMNLWKDKEPDGLEGTTPQSSEKSVVTLSDQITVTETKDKDCVEGTATTSQQETLNTKELEASTVEQPEQLPVAYLANSSICSLPFENAEQVVSADGIQDASMSINDTTESFSNYIIPIEEEDDDDDDDVQFIQESKQVPTVSAADGPSSSMPQTLTTNSSKNSSAVDKNSHDDCNMINVEIKKASNKDKFICQICNRTFFHKGTLTQHMKSHKSNFCSICKQHFPHRNKLNSHTCVPPFGSQRDSKSCEICGKTFANPSALRIHYVVHTGEKPHRCSLCGKGFTQKGNLKCHQRIHTGEKPFRCVRCGRTFTQKINLNHHLMSHRNRGVVEEQPVRHLKKTLAE